MRNEDYVPERFDEQHFKVLIEAKPCATCSTPTVPQLGGYHGPFPKYHRANFEAQIARAGIRLLGTYDGDERPICKPCADKGAVFGTCELCHQQKRSNEMQEQFGSPPDYLCKACYEVTPALAWDRKRAALGEQHKYDFG